MQNTEESALDGSCRSRRPTVLDVLAVFDHPYRVIIVDCYPTGVSDLAIYRVFFPFLDSLKKGFLRTVQPKVVWKESLLEPHWLQPSRDVLIGSL